jgi:acetoin utilization deacetylase AcuC-like enzyme
VSSLKLVHRVEREAHLPEHEAIDENGEEKDLDPQRHVDDLQPPAPQRTAQARKSGSMRGRKRHGRIVTGGSRVLHARRTDGTLPHVSAQVRFVHHPEYHCDIGPHVFPMEKFERVLKALQETGELDARDVLRPDPATDAELERVHTREYLDDLEAQRWTPRTLWSELPLTAGIVHAYRLACGGTILAAREARHTGFAANIGGGFHHAFAERAEGFCYLNDLAVAARVLQAEGLGRVAIVDLDVHQGNGTAAIFEGDASVFTLSIHQENNYPVPKQRSTLDIGLADRIEDAEYLSHLDRALERVWAYDPELLLYQAGADPYREDLLGGLALTRNGLERRDRRVLEGAARRGIPSVITLGGGYARDREDTVAIHAATCRVALALASAERTS